MNKAVWSYPKLDKDVPLGPNLNEAIVVWPELIWFVGIYPNFPIYGNIFNFTKVWMKQSQFAQTSLRLLKYTQMILILSKFE